MECSKCSVHIQDDDKVIQCDSCRTPFHLNEKCSGLCPSEIKAIVVQRRVIFFFCDECKSSFKKVPHLLTKLSVLEKDLSLLKQELKDTKKKHSEELSLLKQELKDMKTNSSAGMEDILTEVHDRALRANNLMLFNAEESKSERLETKIADDKKIAIQVLESIGLESNDLTKVIRIGRQGNKPRPIKMILSNSNVVGQALRLKNRLLNTNLRISSDKTKLQQEQMKKVQDELKQRRDQGSRILLDGVSGDFFGGELTAIMGPSGAGKSILLNVLAGYTMTGTTGDKLVNEEIRNEKLFRKNICYIMQNDNLQPLLTVEESMTVAANLNMAPNHTSQEKQTKVLNIMQSLDLLGNRNTRSQALSGGERRRLSVAMELLKDPQVMFFDEPTSGLDSLSSKQCVSLLKQLALMGRTIICSIHQPSDSIFEMFDHLYVLAQGKCIYQGSVRNVLPYLDELNFTCPNYHSSADYLIEVASGEHGGDLEDLSVKSENGLSLQWRTRLPSSKGNMFRPTPVPSDFRSPLLLPKIENVEVTDCDNNEDSLNQRCFGTYPTSFCNQLSVLLKRTILILSRDKTLTLSRFFTHTGIALFIGILYYEIGVDASNMLNNFNFMFFSVMFLMMTAFNCITTTFPTELPIITREHFNNWYSLISYYLAITIADIPVQMAATLIYGVITYFFTKQPVEGYRICLFLFMCILISLVAQSFGLLIGASMDVKNGVIFGPFCFLPFTIFSGFFVQLNAAHPYARWIFHISFLKYGFEGLVLSVLSYDRDKFPCETNYCQFVYPKQFLHQMDMGLSTYSSAVVFLLCLFVVLRTLAFVALSLQISYNRQHRR